MITYYTFIILSNHQQQQIHCFTFFCTSVIFKTNENCTKKNNFKTKIYIKWNKKNKTEKNFDLLYKNQQKIWFLLFFNYLDFSSLVYFLLKQTSIFNHLLGYY